LKVKNWKFEIWGSGWYLYSYGEKEEGKKINQIDIIKLHNVLKFENWVYKIENKEFELQNLN
jgi:hypothetical protein